MNPWLGITVVLAALGGCFLGLQGLGKRLNLQPEITRKLMHIVMGLMAASFPLMFTKVWPVLLLAAISLPALFLVRCGAAGSLQGVLHGVQRASWGELLFPISIVLLFVLARGDGLLYSVPMLILALADAVAALIGIYYGKFHYSTLEADKSVEGSTAFVLVTFLCVHIAVLLFTATGRLESLLIGALMGVVVMMLEAIAWRGLDNLFIPVSAFALLKNYLAMSASELTANLIVLVALGIFVTVWRKRTTLDDSTLMGTALVAYAAWTLAGMLWMSVFLLMFVIATVLVLCRTTPDSRRSEHSVYGLLSVCWVGLVCLLIGKGISGLDLFYPYALSFGAHLSMLGVSRESLGKGAIGLAELLGWAVMPGWLIVMLPLALIDGLNYQLFGVGLLSYLLLVIVALLFKRLQPGLMDCPVNIERWIRQALLAGSVSFIGYFALPLVIMGV